MSILRLSYDFLPSQLKPCYLYLSIFSAQEDIDCNYLIDLWIAEGFIPKEDTTEDCCSVAWGYLSELFNLCLIEPLDRCVGHIKVGFCKVHDLMRDVCVGICREYTCLSTDGWNFTELLQRPWRRIALPGIQSIPDSARCPPALRTLRLFSNPRLANIPPNFFTDVKVVRVLDLSNTDITTLPESVGNMKLLKVLNLRNTFIREIPACVRRLKGSLQLLDISKPDIVPPGPPIAVPDWIGELGCLRHLSLHSHHSEDSLSKDSRTMPKSLAKLTSLVTLKVGSIKIVLGDKDKLGLEGLGTLTRLQELDLCYGVHLGRLSTLDLRRFTVRGHPTGEVWGFYHLPRLSELECRGWCKVFDEVCDCISLELLRVDFRILEFDGSKLQTMPKLRLLELHGNDVPIELPPDFARPDGFPKLERLVIFQFPSLEELPMLRDGSMRCLKELCVSGCPQLKRIPDGLERLPKLESLRVVNCGEMGERLKENNEDWSKMKGSNNNVQITSYHF